MRAPLLRNARRAAKNALRIPAARGRRARRDDGRNCIGVAPLKRLVPGGRAPLTPSGRSGGRAPLTPIRPIGPGLPQKAGVSLFVATATPIGAIYGRRVTHPSTSRGAWSQRPVLKAEPITRYSWATVSATREPRRGYFTTGSELPQSVTGAVQRGFTRGKRAYMLRGERNRRSIRRKRTRL